MYCCLILPLYSSASVSELVSSLFPLLMFQNSGLMDILIAGPCVVVDVVVVDLSLGGMRVGQPETGSQLRLTVPPLFMASWRSGGGDTPGGMLRLT